MSTFHIHTHGRLQEWVADAQGYFAEEGLADYTLSQVTLPPSLADAPAGAYPELRAGARRQHQLCLPLDGQYGRLQSLHGRLWGEAYSVSPCGIFVAPESGITQAEGSGRRAGGRGLPVGQPLHHHPGAGDRARQGRHQPQLRRLVR